jgi:hypothetical protein
MSLWLWKLSILAYTSNSRLNQSFLNIFIVGHIFHICSWRLLPTFATSNYDLSSIVSESNMRQTLKAQLRQVAVACFAKC